MTEGRRNEFKNFTAFSNPDTRRRIPDPQAESTFLASKLIWEEMNQEPHASVCRLYQALLHLWHTEPALRAADRASYEAAALNDSAILLMRRSSSGPAVLVIIQLLDGGTIDLNQHSAAQTVTGRKWQIILTTEDPEFCADPRRPEVDLSGALPVVRFHRPSAVILRGEPVANGE